MKRQLLRKVMTPAVIVLALVGTLLIFMQFRASMYRELNELTIDFLSRSVDTQAAAFQVKLTDQLIMLESQTRYFADVDLTDYNAMKSTIMSTRGIGAFSSIGVASAAGSTMNYQGKSSGNILLHDYFRRAMAGENAISAEPTTDEFGNQVLTLAVPIRQGDKTVGVVYGTFTQDALSELLESVQFGEQSASVLVTGNGTILARTDEADFLQAGHENIRDAIPGLDIAAVAESPYYAYQMGEKEHILVLRPVGFQDWRFATVVPRSIVAMQRERILKQAALLMLEVGGIVAFLVLYIYHANKRNESERRQLSEKAHLDPLTKILNKASFHEAVEQSLAAAGDSEVCALYIIDMDNFKGVNDNLGHAMGDKVLVDAASKLRLIFRDSDLVGRIGGDEFAAFLHSPKERVPEMDKLVAKKAEAVLSDLKELYEKDGRQVQVSASVGVACYPEQGKDFKSLYENADKALYVAKKGGKNRYEAYR